MHRRGKIALLPPNRVWRTYLGGRRLDELSHKSSPQDGPFPEDWLGSITAARNPTREREEGISTVLVGGSLYRCDSWLRSDPVYLLGEKHYRQHGSNPLILVKVIDSAVHLHFQAHPSSEVARRERLGEFGKTEA